MGGEAALPGVVGCFIVAHACRLQHVFRQFKKGCVFVRILPFLPPQQAPEEFRVFFIGEVVGGDMVRSGADSFLQGGFPYGEGLPRNGEHEIHVDMGHSRIFQHFHGVQSLGRGMFAPQQMQDAGIQGLHTQGDACHAQAAPEAHFFFRKGGGVGLKGEFVQFVHGHETVQGFHETPQMRVREHGGRSPAKVKRGRFPFAVRGQSGCAGFRLPAQSSDE